LNVLKTAEFSIFPFYIYIRKEIKAMAGKLFIVSAPSGTGKTTLVKTVIERLKNRCSIQRVVTFTTKAASIQEKAGEDYHFVSVEEFELKIKAGFFAEWSNAYHAYYGSPLHMLEELALGKSLILVIDRVGAQKLLASGCQAVMIWLRPPHVGVLEQRLVGRGRDEMAVVERRLQLAQQELAEEETNSLYKYHLINDDFNEALLKLEEILLNELSVEKAPIVRSEAQLEGN
jgi:guanylate kinase